DIGHRLLPEQIPAIVVAPQHTQAARHAHGVDDLGIASVGLGHTAAKSRKMSGLSRGAARKKLRQEGDCYEGSSADGSYHADPRMKQVADAEIERHPWQIEQGGRSDCRHERTELIQVA